MIDDIDINNTFINTEVKRLKHHIKTVDSNPGGPGGAYNLLAP